MEVNKESILIGYPKVITYECTKKILEQMEKSISKIKIGKEQGTGFFCKIPFPDKNHLLPVFITNNHVLNEELLYKKDSKILINIKEEKKQREINLNDRMKYTNKDYDITIVEIKEKDNISNYLKLDNNIIEDIISDDDNNNNFIDKTIYIIQYPEGELSVSYGILENIYIDKKYNFNHKCSTKAGSSGSPILNLNNKLIGIHKEGVYNKFNKGTFLSYPIKEFIKSNYNTNNNIEELNITSEDLNEKLFKEFKIKYNLTIKNTSIEVLDFSDIIIGNEGFKDLTKINFRELKELYFLRSNISEMNGLEEAKFNKLEKFGLRLNKVSDIGILKKVNFQKLKQLILSWNYISDITVLEKVKFNYLELLDLNGNRISDISILKNVNFIGLKNLDLSNNKISDITVLEKVKFNQLEILNLNYNRISDISILKKVNFKKLEELCLKENRISDITVFENFKFGKLEILNLSDNYISEIDILTKVDFQGLNELDLSLNRIDKNKNQFVISKLVSKINNFII